MKPSALSSTVTLIISFSPNLIFVEFTVIVVFSLSTVKTLAASAVV